MVADVPIPTHLPRWVCWRSWGGRLAKEAGVGVSLKAWGSAIRVTQTLSVSLWISLSPHLTRSESHWFSICVVLSMSLILFLSSFFLVHWPSHTACRILVPQPRMEPMPPALEVQGLNHWAARQSLSHSVSDLLISCCLRLHSHRLLSVSPCPVSPLLFPFCLPISLPIFSFSSTS